MPHISVSGDVEEPKPEATPAPKTNKKLILIGAGALVAVLVLGGGAYFFIAGSKPPPPPPPKPKAAAPAAKKAAAPAQLPPAATKPAQPGPALSETQAAIAHAPVNAVNKAKDTVAARQNSGQGRDAVGAITDGDKPAVPEKTAEKSGPTAASVATALAPGVAAPTTEIQAAAEASAAFRAFIANAKIGGLFQGATPRVLINGRTLRAGETVDAGLGIVFDSYDAEKKHLVFKDKTGAVVTRRYP